MFIEVKNIPNKGFREKKTGKKLVLKIQFQNIEVCQIIE
jgi:hypothetical protein